MVRVLGFFILLLHMNASMFLPQGPEIDVFDENGQQMEDINTVMEWILVSLGIDNTPDDEDDDAGQNFMGAHYQYVMRDKLDGNGVFFFCNSDKKYHTLTDDELAFMWYDVAIPPPDSNQNKTS